MRGRRAVTDMMPQSHGIKAAPVQKVVVVNGNSDVLGMLESVLDAGRYDMVFVESGDRAYSRIKQVLPHLVILCTPDRRARRISAAHDAEARPRHASCARS